MVARRSRARRAGDHAGEPRRKFHQRGRGRGSYPFPAQRRRVVAPPGVDARLGGRRRRAGSCRAARRRRGTPERWPDRRRRRSDVHPARRHAAAHPRRGRRRQARVGSSRPPRSPPASSNHSPRDMPAPSPRPHSSQDAASARSTSSAVEPRTNCSVDARPPCPVYRSPPARWRRRRSATCASRRWRRARCRTTSTRSGASSAGISRLSATRRDRSEPGSRHHFPSAASLRKSQLTILSGTIRSHAWRPSWYICPPVYFAA